MITDKQRTKLNSEYSSWADLLEGFPREYILGPLLFHIFLCDLLIIIDTIYIASYADDNTPYVIRKRMTYVLQELETMSKKLFVFH